AAAISRGLLSRAGCGLTSLFVPRNTGSNDNCSKLLGSRQVDMTNFLIILPVLAGILLWWVSRNDRRRQFVPQRLQELTARREIADPVGGELRRALGQVQVGVTMNDALQEAAERIRIADFRFFVVALTLQQRTGGSLAETLANLSGVIRARKALRLKARALTA